MKNYQLNTLARITLLVTLNLSLIACGGGGDTAAEAITPTPIPTNTDCVFGTSKIGDCSI